MERNIVLLLSYDGTGLLGWQHNGEGPTVEGHLQAAVEQILQHSVKLQAASRTDAGVHAEGQVVNFFTNRFINLDALLKGINALLPKTIRVMDIWEAKNAFHPTLDCKKKAYAYFVCTSGVQMPHTRHFSWHYPYVLDLPAMQRAAEHFSGTHAFDAFMGKCDPLPKTTERTLESVIVEQQGSDYIFQVVGENFLYKMVRNIVGTLVYVGRGKIDPMTIPEIIASCQRERAGVTAPAHGLRLKKVYYDFEK